ncbi:MAG: nucleoside-diphosphate sugar epimerase/dehydratase, partial [Acidobacteriota bacterium]|nr:nucleoside-diphosphate sugar epimerase/dehydratase [Acidobacteriota bacterium]
PALAGERVRKAYQAASPRGVHIRILPRLEHALLGADLGRFHDPDITDLLRRPPRKLDRDRMREWVRGRRVLITGAGGSIGSELSRQVAQLEPAALALLDASELNLFNIHGEMAPRHGPILLRPYMVDVRDGAALRRVFAEVRPEVVFHAAAYKHVPLMEDFPEEALRTNVLGTLDLAQLAVEHHVEKFVNISTDKAVKPCSVMGASKRLAEMACQALNGNGTHFLSVRFGNVLGSRGSVVPLFQEQIRRGGPLTLTHPDMRRYFMSIPEAVLLVFQAAHQGRGGEVFVLDMGEPVRIRDLAENLIRLNGLEPGKDIEIVATGMRPGEKLFEELLTAEEGVDSTSHDKIYVARFKEPIPAGFLEKMAADCRAAGRDAKKIRALFAAHIPTYHEE